MTKLSRVLAAALSLPAAVFVAYLFTPPLARLDDSYIALHSARVALSGHDPVFGAPALAGVTSPAYVGLLMLILSTGIANGDAALRFANALGIVAFGAAVWYLGRTAQLSVPRRVALLVVALGSGVVLVVNLTNGLETGWALATLTFAIAAARDGRYMLGAAAAGLLPFLRPDLAPAAAIVLLYAVRARRFGEQAAAVFLAIAVAVPWLVWMRWDTGEWITQTARAKQLFYAEGCRPWSDKLATVTSGVAIGLAQLFPLSLGVIPLFRDKLGRAGLASVFVAVSAYYVAFPGALEHPNLRYVTALVVPWLCLGAARGLARVPMPAAVAAGIAVVAAQVIFDRNYDASYSRDIKETAQWIDTALPRDAILLVHDAGGISEFAHHRAVDLVGLKTPSSMAAHARWTWPSCVAARGTAVTAIARDSGARYFVAVTGWDEYLRPNLIDGGFELTPIRRPPDGKGYTVYRMDIRR